ncbi:pyridoxal phosphate-dependent aminotransferase [Lactobacillaceae bacterium L1_55_11]|nr:pyridoxal phosphate-dependent aminotransferase [Lactobacillaceae bacterium L1_55_11]
MGESFQLAKRVSEVAPSPTLAVSAQAKKMQAEGVDVVNLGMGEPDFTTPDNIGQAAQAAIQSGKTSFYTPVTGLPALKQAIVDRMSQRYHYGNTLTTENVAVTAGAKLSLYVLMQVLVNPGDVVVTANPEWVSYVEQVKLAGGVFQGVLPGNPALKLTRADLEGLTVSPKVLLINSPTNPTGQVYSREELIDLLDWAKEHDTFVILDEIYGQLVYNGAVFTSGLDLQSLAGTKVIIVDGVSKAYAMTGWRIGWTLADATIIAAMTKLLGHITSNPAAVSQYAAIEALTGSQDSVEKMRQAFEQRLNATYAALSEIPALELPVKPQGAFYLFPKVNPKVMEKLGYTDTTSLSQAILDQAHVAVPGGEGFGMPGYFRISYAKDQAQLDEAVARLKQFFSQV